LKPKTDCTLLTQAWQYLTTVYQSVYQYFVKYWWCYFWKINIEWKVYQARSWAYINSVEKFDRDLFKIEAKDVD